MQLQNLFRKKTFLSYCMSFLFFLFLMIYKLTPEGLLRLKGYQGLQGHVYHVNHFNLASNHATTCKARGVQV